MKHQYQHQIFFLALFLILFGVIIRYQIGKQRFNRRTITGLQQFRTYNEAMATRGGEGCLGMIGSILIFGGIILLFVAIS